MAVPKIYSSALFTHLVPAIVGMTLSGCAYFSLEERVPATELEAERQQRQTLEVKQEQLLEELSVQTSALSKLKEQLATEVAQRQALEQQKDDAAQDLQQQISAKQAQINTLTEQLEAAILKAEDMVPAAVLEEQLATENLERKGWKWEQSAEQNRGQPSGAREVSDGSDPTLYLMLLEKKARIASLTEEIEDILLEVVRAKAKLRSLESKAETASNLAEAEIALESLQANGDQWKSDPDVIKGGQLIELSAREFEDENYGGSLYLTSQAKNLIKDARARSMRQELRPMVEGEIAFSMPLTLLLLSNSNIREGPGSQFGVLYSLEKGSALVADTYKGQWVRVKSEDGRGGWVFYKLVGSDYERR